MCTRKYRKNIYSYEKELFQYEIINFEGFLGLIMKNFFLFSVFLLSYFLNVSFLYAGHHNTKIIRDDDNGEKEKKGVARASSPQKSKMDKIKRIRRAATKGDAEAQYQLGLMYEYGKNVTKSAEQARECYEKAANQGHAEAQYALGFYYFTSKDFEKAIKWFQKAADQGYQAANEPLKNIKTFVMARKRSLSS